MKIFEYDGWLMTLLTKLTDCILLGLLWLVASIPVVTIGAATVAMYFTVENAIRKDRGNLFSTFWVCFRREFSQATKLWGIAILFIAVLGIICYFSYAFTLPGVINVFVVIAANLCVGWMLLWFGYLSKFQDRMSVLLKNTFVMMLLNIHWIALLVLYITAAVSGTAVSVMTGNPVYFVLIPGLYGVLSWTVMWKIFRKYLPEESQNRQETVD